MMFSSITPRFQSSGTVKSPETKPVKRNSPAVSINTTPQSSRTKQALAATWLGLSTLLSAGLGTHGAALAQPPQATAPQAQTAAAPKNNPVLVDIDKKLRGDGLVGRMHGADAKSSLFVFNFINKGETVIDSTNFSVIPETDDAKKALETLKRHDKVLIKGHLKNLNNPQPHIVATRIELKESFQVEGTTPAEPFHKLAKLPEELKGKTSATFLVHANINNGQAIVLEYKDQLVMLVTRGNTEFTQDLWRGDRIEVRFSIREYPDQPTHLALDTDTTDGKEPVHMLDKLGGPDRGKNLDAPDYKRPLITQQGALVKFPKSPTINRDIWAIEQKDDSGASRYFTLVNFEIEGEFDRIGAKMKALWETANKPSDIADGRNKQIHKTIRIEVQGELNVEQKNQANAQIFLTADDIQQVP